MKTKRLICVLLVLICCLAIVLTACDDASHEQIVAEYAELHNVKHDITLTCYGEFRGAHVVYIEGLISLQMLSDLRVAGVTFHFPTLQQFDVYFNGKFYTLSQAFWKGLLTHKNLLEIRDKHKADYEYLYK